jgi:hypothetical protein
MHFGAFSVNQLKSMQQNLLKIHGKRLDQKKEIANNKAEGQTD